MKRALQRRNNVWHYRDSLRHEGPPPDVRGDLSGVSGDLSGVWGDLSGVRGYLTDVRGDLDTCGLTDDDRTCGVWIEDLIVAERKEGE